MKSTALLLVLLTAASFCPSCRQETEEDKVRRAFDSVTRLAEKKDLEGLMAYVAEDFRDFEGRDKAGLRRLASAYFSGREGIVVHRLSARIGQFASEKCSLEADVALSSGGAEALRRLVRVSPDIYRLRVDLVKMGEDDWQMAYAEWAEITWTDLFPESLTPLRELFPRSRTEN